MKKEINPIILVVVAVVLLGGVVWGAIYFTTPRTPAGVKYTPGVPPWMEKGAKGGYDPRAPAGAPK